MAGEAQTEVLIAGAGPFGLMLACELGRRGIDCLLIDPKTSIADAAQANATQARTMEHFRRLGLAAEIRALGLPLDHPTDIGYFTRFAGPDQVLAADSSGSSSPFLCRSLPRRSIRRRRLALRGHRDPHAIALFPEVVERPAKPQLHRRQRPRMPQQRRFDELLRNAMRQFGRAP